MNLEHTSAKGKFRVSVIDAKTGRTVSEGAWHPNLILDCGLDMVGITMWQRCLTYCYAGTGNTPTKDICDGHYTLAGTTLTRENGTRDFIAGDVGKLVRFNDGTERYISGYTSATVVTVGASGTIPSTLASKAISAAASDATTLTITAVAHGRSVGDRITIAGVTPSGYNGNWTIATVPDADTLTITDSANPGIGILFGTLVTAAVGILIYRVNQTMLTSPFRRTATYPSFLWEDGEPSQAAFWDDAEGKTTIRRTYDFAEETANINYTEIGLSPEHAVGVSVSSATSNSTTLTFNCASNHGLTTGNSVLVWGMLPAAYNGLWTVASTPSGTQFTVTNAANPGNSTQAGRIRTSLFNRILLPGAVTVLSGQLLRVKFELTVKQHASLAPIFTDEAIPGWPRPYNVNGVTNAAGSWTVTTDVAHHYVAAGKINLRNTIRPKITITAASSNVSDFTITAAAHGRSPGDVILIEGVTPSAYNGRWTIASSATNTITVTSALNPGTGSAFGTVREQEPRGTIITAAASTSTGFTITAVAHGLSIGNRVVIKGMTPDGYNGNWIIATVPTADTFTVLSTANPGTGTAFGDCYDNAATTPPWYDGEWTIASVTSTTVLITKAATPPVAGLGGTAFNNVRRTFKALTYGVSCNGFTLPTGTYANYALGSDILQGPMENWNPIEEGNAGYSNSAIQLNMQAVGITTPPTGFPRVWDGTNAYTYGTNVAQETGLSSLPQQVVGTSGDNANATQAAYVSGNFYRQYLVTYGAGSGNRTDIRMITITGNGVFNGSLNSRIYPNWYLLFEERQRKDSTHKLTFTFQTSWNRDLTTEAS